jgi:hypothetical protein
LGGSLVFIAIIVGVLIVIVVLSLIFGDKSKTTTTSGKTAVTDTAESKPKSVYEDMFVFYIRRGVPQLDREIKEYFEIYFDDDRTYLFIGRYSVYIVRGSNVVMIIDKPLPETISVDDIRPHGQKHYGEYEGDTAVILNSPAGKYEITLLLSTGDDVETNPERDEKLLNSIRKLMFKY